MSTLKIAFIGQKGIPATLGGVEYHVKELSERLVKRGHEVSVYVRNWYTKRNLSHYKKIKLIHTPTIKTKHLDAITHAFSSSIDSIFRNCDVVHFHALGPSFFCPVPKLARKKVIVTVHGLDWQTEKWKKFAKVFLRFCEYSVIYFPDETIVVSKTLKDYFKRKFGKECIYIPNGVNIPKLRSAKLIREKYGLKGKDYIFFMGRLVPSKRVEWLIEAFKIMLNTKNLIPNFKLVISGGSSATDNYVRKLEKLAQGNKRIIFTNYITSHEKEELFSNALLFVLPSYVEGLPIALLEAMSYGVPCLASDISPHREIITDGVEGFLFQSDNFCNLAAKLDYLLKNSKELKTVTQKAKQKVEKEYNWSKIIDQVEEVYHRVLKR